MFRVTQTCCHYEKMADFLKELPSYNETNFTRFHADSGNGKTNMKRPAVYISTKDYPEQQIITTEKTNILLRYLHQQWDRKNSCKRDSTRASLESCEGTSPQKMPRLSQEDDNS
ncbi:hypothetical protein ACJMK2_043253 [Sinanodonta woodiana]|uniref:DET1- and DDB1-associated protein 1 n=1 Tax=Sinanodonta woodiana TaxID=1069815 RepID=A0ABD3VX44_SINWO